MDDFAPITLVCENARWSSPETKWYCADCHQPLQNDFATHYNLSPEGFFRIFAWVSDQFDLSYGYPDFEFNVLDPSLG